MRVKSKFHLILAFLMLVCVIVGVSRNNYDAVITGIFAMILNLVCALN